MNQNLFILFALQKIILFIGSSLPLYALRFIICVFIDKIHKVYYYYYYYSSNTQWVWTIAKMTPVFRQGPASFTLIGYEVSWALDYDS